MKIQKNSEFRIRFSIDGGFLQSIGFRRGFRCRIATETSVSHNTRAHNRAMIQRALIYIQPTGLDPFGIIMIIDLRTWVKTVVVQV